MYQVTTCNAAGVVTAFTLRIGTMRMLELVLLPDQNSIFSRMLACLGGYGKVDRKYISPKPKGLRLGAFEISEPHTATHGSNSHPQSFMSGLQICQKLVASPL